MMKITNEKELPNDNTITLFVLPDVHASPEDNTNFSRLTAAGNYIADNRIDHVVCLGDFADMSSLCSYDKGTKGFEGRRYKEDIKACRNALETFHKPIRDYQEFLRQGHRKAYKPTFHMLIGNHEERILRAVEKEATLEGVLTLDDLNFKEYGWNCYLRPFNMFDITFGHSFPSGLMNRPISGDNQASLVLSKNYNSSCCGHSHVLDYATRVTADHKRLHSFVCGCFTEESPKYAGEASKFWWRGCIVIKLRMNILSFEHEIVSHEFITLDELKKEYL